MKNPTKQNPFKVGDVLVCIWGYSMVITDFWQVTKATAATVTLRQIESQNEHTGYLSGNSVPLKDKFAEAPHVFCKRGELELVRRVKPSPIDGKAQVRMTSHAWASLIEEGRKYTFDHWD